MLPNPIKDTSIWPNHAAIKHSWQVNLRLPRTVLWYANAPNLDIDRSMGIKWIRKKRNLIQSYDNR